MASYNVRTVRDTVAFSEMLSCLLSRGHGIRFRANGESMGNSIFDGEAIHVASIDPAALRRGDVIFVRGQAGFKAHRLLALDAERDLYVTRGDAAKLDDDPLTSREILGKVVAVERYGRWVRLERRLAGRVRQARNIVAKTVRASMSAAKRH